MSPLCNGIHSHTDTVWQRCPKAETCQRYQHRKDDQAYVVDRLCNTVEFEHYMEIPNET